MLRTGFLLALAFADVLHGQMCTGRTLSGPYSLLLSGTVKISGKEAPAAALAALTLSDDGTVSGQASVNFDGLLLGNPVTGKYELHPDCTLDLSLQDDSGAFQHFRGTMPAQGDRVDMRQTDAGTEERSVLQKTADNCSDSGLRAAYSFTLSGTATTIATGGAPRPISVAGTVARNESGKFVINKPVTAPVTFDVQSDCVVLFEMANFTATGNPAHFRGMVVNRGTQIMAIQTDPGHAVAAVFVAR